MLSGPTPVSSQSSSVQEAGESPDRKPKWVVLAYLAGDVSTLEDAIERDLAELLRAGGSQGLAVLAQHDGPAGARRYVVARRAGSTALTTELGPVDSGEAASLSAFLRWGLAHANGARVALVVRGDGVRELHEHEEGDAPSGLFTVCRDDRAGSSLDAVTFGSALRAALDEQGRERLELLAIDTCYTQFLELAYELEGRVDVVVASQALSPGEGWDYSALLERWSAAIAAAPEGALDAVSMARTLVPALVEAYERSGRTQPYTVSALDLRQLDDVARAFDTLCMSVMQALGAGLIWQGRRLLMELMDRLASSKKLWAYDCGSLFTLFSATMDAMADEAVGGWLGTTLQRSAPRSLELFRSLLVPRLEALRERSADPRRVERWIDALSATDMRAAGTRMLADVGDGVIARLALLEPGHDASRWKAAKELAMARDAELASAVTPAVQALAEERRLELERAEETAQIARRLAEQAWQAARMVLGSDVALYDRADRKERYTMRAGLVLTVATAHAAQQGWPRWAGVSLYRPPRLDQLMKSAYQEFTFHQRIHWAALLGAVNLIESHPRALWRLVSSLLSTGGAGTRRDVLSRLTGRDSVVWGLRNQFRVMAPAPTLTVSLERQDHAQPDGEPLTEPGLAPSEHYLLRLESASGGAVVSEQQSRVQPRVLNRALHELKELLGAPVVTADSFRRLRSVGSLLGEDIFQVLGRTLEEERVAALSDSGSGSVHLSLQLPRELMGYPWELMHQRGEWLSERFAVGRQVFMQTGLARRVPKRRQGRVRPLIIGDPVFDAGVEWPELPGARAEAEQVAGWFERLRDELGDVIDFDRKRDALIHTRVTCDELRRRLREDGYDIVHFAGHSKFHAHDPEASAWLLSDGELWALEIRNTLMDHPAPPWLVYANACESAMESSKRTYQGNVFGLATAFINQGVAAYIAPLWPIDDMLAQEIALTFYRELLCERTTLGEALRRAKARARIVATPTADEERAGTGAWASLGWASLVLYGDPTEELFQALAGGKLDPRARSSEPPAREQAPRPLLPRPMPLPRPYLHAADHVLRAWLAEPTALRQPKPSGLRGERESIVDTGEPVLELIEEAGLRRFRLRGTAAGTRGAPGMGHDGLPGSDLARILSDERVRRALPGQRGAIRIIGRWILSGFADGLTGFVREYDRDQVASEGILMLGDGGLAPLTRDALAATRPAGRERVLLVVHGTFSNAASPVEGLGRPFMQWARQRYRAVIALDHWTLSKTPLDNARLLTEQLRMLAPELLEERRLDVISHSRGGLVARSFCSQPEAARAVRNLVFLGTPNCGTDLANPDNWGAMADALINMTGLDHAQLFGRLAGLLARLAVAGGTQAIPGLLAQNPLAAGLPGEFLHTLQQPLGLYSGVRLAFVTTEFEPTPLIPNLKALWGAAKQAGLDALVDKLFGVANDLVVNTSNVWCIEQPSSAGANLPAFVDPERVLAYVPPTSSFALPARVRRVEQLGVHHTNLYAQPATHEAIKRWLE
jgi:hypothetical protein